MKLVTVAVRILLSNSYLNESSFYARKMKNVKECITIVDFYYYSLSVHLKSVKNIHPWALPTANKTICRKYFVFNYYANFIYKKLENKTA